MVRDRPKRRHEILIAVDRDLLGIFAVRTAIQVIYHKRNQAASRERARHVRRRARVAPTTRLTDRARAVGLVIHRLRKAAASRRVASAARGGAWIHRAVIASRAAIGCRARWAHVHTQLGAAANGKAHASNAADKAVARWIERLVRSDRRHREIEVCDRAIRHCRRGDIDVSDRLRRPCVWPSAAKIGECDRGVRYVEVEALPDAWRTRRWRASGRRGR